MFRNQQQEEQSLNHTVRAMRNSSQVQSDAEIARLLQEEESSNVRPRATQNFQSDADLARLLQAEENRNSNSSVRARTGFSQSRVGAPAASAAELEQWQAELGQVEQRLLELNNYRARLDQIFRSDADVHVHTRELGNICRVFMRIDKEGAYSFFGDIQQKFNEIRTFLMRLAKDMDVDINQLETVLGSIATAGTQQTDAETGLNMMTLVARAWDLGQKSSYNNAAELIVYNLIHNIQTGGGCNPGIAGRLVQPYTVFLLHVLEARYTELQGRISSSQRGLAPRRSIVHQDDNNNNNNHLSPPRMRNDNNNNNNQATSSQQRLPATSSINTEVEQQLSEGLRTLTFTAPQVLAQAQGMQTQQVPQPEAQQVSQPVASQFSDPTFLNNWLNPIPNDRRPQKLLVKVRNNRELLLPFVHQELGRIMGRIGAAYQGTGETSLSFTDDEQGILRQYLLPNDRYIPGAASYAEVLNNFIANPRPFLNGEGMGQLFNLDRYDLVTNGAYFALLNRHWSNHSQSPAVSLPHFDAWLEQLQPAIRGVSRARPQ